MNARLLLAAAAIAFAPAAAFAQGNTIGGTVGGAAIGGAVGGPVGAVGGAIIGGTMGAAMEPPPPAVTTYVARERAPSVRIQEEVVVGQPLPRTVKLRTVPRHKKYSYAIVNDRRVIVEPRTRRVIQVLD